MEATCVKSMEKVQMSFTLSKPVACGECTAFAIIFPSNAKLPVFADTAFW